MTRNMILGWALLMGLFLAWTQYKSKQAEEFRQQQAEIALADSLAQAGVEENRSGAALSSPREPRAPAGEQPSRETRETRPTAAQDAERRIITVETEHFTVVLDGQGGRISELRVPSIAGKAPYNPLLIRPDSEGALTLSLNGTSLADVIWAADTEETWFRVDSVPLTITFSTTLQSGEPVERAYTFVPGESFVRHRVFARDGAIRSYAVEWNGGLEETDRIETARGIGLLATYFSEIIFHNGSMTQRESFDGDKSYNVQSGVIRWAGMRRKYVAVVMDFGRDIHDRLEATGFSDPTNSSAPRRYSMRIAGNTDETGVLNFDFRVMPLHYATIRAADRGFEQILFSGWEWFFRADVWYVKLCGLVLNLLNMFFGWIPNYGIAIILLTFLVRFITLPLSINQTRQAAKLAVHQPEIRKIQEKYKGERQKMQMEIMEYYRKQGINPMAPLLGCFPLLLQMPVFIALFNVLGRAVELHEMPFFGWISDLSRPDVIWSGFTVPFIFPVGLTVLPFFMAFTMWIQMKLTIKDPNQKALVWIMPIMLFVFSSSFPSGLVLYWTMSNVFTIGQTKIFGTVAPLKPVDGNGTPAKASPTPKAAAAKPSGGKSRKKK